MNTWNSNRGNDLVVGQDARGNPIILSAAQRSLHTYSPGATGGGKSKLIELLVRQDMLSWPETHCGMIVFDPHGKLFDDLLAWVAAENLHHLPIVPIDLRRSETTVCYNALRRRQYGDPAAVVSSIVRTVTHIWEGNGNTWPRFEKWFSAFLMLMYDLQMTLAEILQLINSRELRQAVIPKIQDTLTRRIWEGSMLLNEAAFQEQIESTVNRIRRLLSSQVMRAMLCQTKASLDLGNALDEGSIILVSLATEGGHVDEQDAKTLGGLLVSDLWTAAKARGKRDDVRPFYVYIDEFQEFLSPTMAKTLDQSRGFGLHFYLAQQYPSQNLIYGDQGRAIFNSIMANARNKIVFSLEHPEDLELLAQWMFRQHVNVDEIKHELWSRKVIDHELVYLRSFSQSVSDGVTEGDTWSYTEQETEGISTQRSHTDTLTEGSTVGNSLTENRGTAVGASRGLSEGTSESDALDWGATDSNTAGQSNSHSRSIGVGYALRQGRDGDGRTSNPSDPVDRGTPQSLSETEGNTHGNSNSRAHIRADGGARSSARQSARSQGASTVASSGTATGHFDSFSGSTSAADAVAEGRSWQNSTARSVGGNSSTSHVVTNGITDAPMLQPVMGSEISSVQFRSVEEQFFRYSQFLAGQPDRHFIVRLAGERFARPARTLTVEQPVITNSWVRSWIDRRLKRLPFTLPTSEALLRINERERVFSQMLLGDRVFREPRRSGRLIKRT
jgi:hypothetical protein